MLRLFDAGSGRAEEIRPARRGELRMCSAGDGLRPLAGGLRSWLLADLISRAAQRHGLMVLALVGPPGAGEPGGTQPLLAGCEALNIRPLQGLPASPGETADIGVDLRGHGAAQDDEAPGTGLAKSGAGALPPRAASWARAAPLDGDALAAVTAGAATGPGTATATATATVTGPGSASGPDPLALRLALLRWHYRQPATITRADLGAADADLRHWRERVALWANAPSRAMRARYTADIGAAFDNDLNTPEALRILGVLDADGEIPAGSKFEMFAHLDQLLGLDLARDVGR